MNANEAKLRMESDITYKGVATLVPPALYLARALGNYHGLMGYPLGLCHLDLSSKPKWVAENPENFRAMELMFSNGEIALTVGSGNFPNAKPTPDEFAAILQGDITFI